MRSRARTVAAGRRGHAPARGRRGTVTAGVTQALRLAVTVAAQPGSRSGSGRQWPGLGQGYASLAA